MREFLIKKKHSRAFVSVLHLLLKPHSSCEAAVPEVDLVDLAAAGLVLVVSEEEGQRRRTTSSIVFHFECDDASKP